MNTKPKLAYIVRQQEAAAVVYATSPAAARRQGAAEIDSTFEEVDSCCRAKDLDQYAYGDFGTDKVMINEHNWEFECNECFELVNQRTEERCFNEHGTVFCSPACLGTHEVRLNHRA